MIPQVLNPSGESIDRELPPPFVKIVGPQVTVHFMAGEHVKDTAHDGVRYGNDSPLLSTAYGEALVEGGAIGVLGPHGGMGELGQDRPEGPIALTRSARAVLTRAFVVAWGHPGPRGQARCRLKPRHIRPNLRHDDFCPALVHPRNRVQEFDSACKGKRGRDC